MKSQFIINETLMPPLFPFYNNYLTQIVSAYIYIYICTFGNYLQKHLGKTI